MSLTFFNVENSLTLYLLGISEVISYAMLLTFFQNSKSSNNCSKRHIYGFSSFQMVVESKDDSNGTKISDFTKSTYFVLPLYGSAVVKGVEQI